MSRALDRVRTEAADTAPGLDLLFADAVGERKRWPSEIPKHSLVSSTIPTCG